MYLCCLRSYPEGFNSIPPMEESDRFQDRTQEIRRVQADLQKLPFHYRSMPALRVAVIAALVVGISVALMAMNGSLSAFPQNFTAWFQNLNWTYAGIGAGAFVVLSIGAGVVIRRVKSLHNPLTNSGIGKLSGDAHFQEAYYIRNEDADLYYEGYIDRSTLDRTCSGYAFFYGKKSLPEHYYISLFVAATTPAHAAASIAYHIVRLVAIPFYILGSMAREAYRDRPIYEEQRGFELGDIRKQMFFSLKQIVKAPFYAAAHFYAALYSLIDPLNGRKLGAAIENDWNNGVNRSDGFWSVRGPQSSSWLPEGGGGPDKLGKNGFYAAGCWTPMARVQFENGKIVGCESMTRALHPERGGAYTITTIDTLRERHNAAVAAL